MDTRTASDPQRNEATYAVYLCLHATQAHYPRKTLRVVISELMYADPYAWRAVGITRAALQAYNQASRDRIKGIQRAHLTDRKDMVDYLFDQPHPWSQADLFKYWRNADRCVIALASENVSNILGDWMPFDNAEARYFPPAPIGFKLRHKIEGDLVRRLWLELVEIEATTSSPSR